MSSVRLRVKVMFGESWLIKQEMKATLLCHSSLSFKLPWMTTESDGGV